MIAKVRMAKAIETLAIRVVMMRAQNVKNEEVSMKRTYFKGKDQKSIEDIMEKALAAWFAAEGGADV